MRLEKLQQQVLELPISDRWQLVQSVLASIQQETLSLSVSNPTINSLTNLAPWTQNLIGVIQLGTEDPTETYVDFLEEKYN
ncbi:MAG: hypothetical protein KME35_13475 [Aphanocapsa sp. GSE-SYN-MK-11-07L]|jgi:hypothetical protein|nr:hypothetical protein [Aphanocapsa sp. GSE-SYN-MK-11-07L]